MVSATFLPDPAIYAKYSPYGITISDDGKMLQYNGQRVRLFVDQHSDIETFFLDDAGALGLSVTRHASGDITGIESISARKAQEYHSAAKEYEQNVLNGLDEKVAARMKALYPEN